jgi:hypothetical protein
MLKAIQTNRAPSTGGTQKRTVPESDEAFKGIFIHLSQKQFLKPGSSCPARVCPEAPVPTPKVVLGTAHPGAGGKKWVKGRNRWGRRE